jgi:hypothetical protein
MRGPVSTLLCCLVALASSANAFGCDRDTGAREQKVFLSWNHQPIKNWTASVDHVEAIELPNGFRLGVQIEPASAEKYSMLFLSAKHVPELVQVTLFDLGKPKPHKLSSTWGGSNSVLNYGADGGTDQVDTLGSPGIELTLLKPVCAEEPKVL